ncbi:MAG: cyclic pyranopterin monophosphate synthase MoaC [Spirochaetes bacterium]|nr:MAG: cyclic pyranopterin monophosphate synthase MoaC [Spirochaetota bacterium]
MAEFTHYSGEGSPTMVDVSGKSVTSRKARASGFVRMRAETLDLISSRLLPKGNLFEIAKIAGISAAKRTSDLIPLCHPLLINFVDVSLFIEESLPGVRIESEVRVEGRTGAEMEALTAVAAAALTVYDMCKAVDKTMVVENIRLIEKRGGKSDFSI